MSTTTSISDITMPQTFVDNAKLFANDQGTGINAYTGELNDANNN